MDTMKHQRHSELRLLCFTPRVASNRKTENQVKARRLRHANAGPSTGPRYARYFAARGRARILLPVVCPMTERRFSLVLFVTSAARHGHGRWRTCPRGPCGAGGLLDLPRCLLPASRAACAASAGRAGGSCFFLILSPSPHH